MLGVEIKQKIPPCLIREGFSLLAIELVDEINHECADCECADEAECSERITVQIWDMGDVCNQVAQVHDDGGRGHDFLRLGLSL